MIVETEVAADADAEALRSELVARVREEDGLLEAIAASTLDGLWFQDVEDPSRVWLSPRLRTLLGTPAARADGPSDWWAAFADPADAARIAGAVARASADPDTRLDEVVRLTRADKSIVWVRLRALLLSDHVGRPTRLLGGVTDVTSLREAEERLRRTSEIHAAILEATDEGILRLSAVRSAAAGDAVDFTVEEANPGAAALLGRDRDGLIGGCVSELFPSIFRTAAFTLLRQAFGESRRNSFEMRYLAEGLDGLYRVNVYPTGAEDIVVTLKDVGELRRASVRLHEQEALLREVVETVPDAVAAYDADDRLVLCNDAFRRYYARSAAAIRLGATFEEILREGVVNGEYPEAGDTDAEREAFVQRRLAQHRAPGRSHLVRVSDERWLQIRERRSPTGHTVGVRTDVTKLKAVEAQLKRHAERDVLTELPNRKVFFDHLDRIARTAAGAEPWQPRPLAALVLFDMDHFKDINDTLGHDVGDEVLKEIARRLAARAVPLSMVARLGGDEFAATTRGLRRETDCAEAVAELQDLLSLPMAVGERTVSPRFSIGVAMIPRDGTDAPTLFKNADIALYEAKRRGRGRFSFFDPLIRDRLDRRAAVIERLRAAVAADDLEIALQPQVEVDGGRHVGFEALVRWEADGEEISPREFVPLAEETGLAAHLGGAVLTRALAFARRAIDAGLDPGLVAVNVSAGQLKADGFAATVRDLLGRYRIDPWRLCLEMTELVLLDRATGLIENALAALREIGVGFALDDFGTGHASLTNVKRFPVDRIKIDASFVRDIGTDPDDAVIVRAIVNLAHSLGKTAVAEGVESAEQLAFLRLNGCDVAQGFHIGGPWSERDAERHLARLAAHDRG